MSVGEFPATSRPGAPTFPAHAKFLSAEAESTAALMGFFQAARYELETFIREGDLTVSDATFYRQLLDETQRIGSKLNAKGATWTSSVIPESYSSGWRMNSSTVVPQKALEALSRETMSLIRDTTEGIRLSIRHSIATGILEGLPGEAIRQRILSSGLSNIPHWPSVEYRAGVIARTETMRAFNTGNVASIVENGARYAEWIASPDEATCRVCMPRDGKIFRTTGNSFTPATSHAEATERFKKSGLFKEAPDWAKGKEGWFEGLPLDVRNGILEEGERLRRLGVAGVISSTGTYHFADAKQTEAAHVRAGRIEFADDYDWGARSSGLMVGGNTPGDVFRHEYGHLIENAGGSAAWRDFQSKLSGLDDIPEIPSFKTLRRYDGKGIDASHEIFAEYFASAFHPNHAAGSLPHEGLFLDTLKAADLWQEPSGGAGPDGSDPYPNAIPLPKIPAHPRCRCTVRAVYRDPSGRVIGGGAAGPEPPELPGDAMGGDQPPEFPPSAGDLSRSLGGLRRDFDTYLSGKAFPDETRAFWRSLGKLDQEALDIITSGTLTNAKLNARAVFFARYGIAFNDAGAWSKGSIMASIRALETVRAANPRFVVDSEYLTHWGSAPAGARKMSGGRAAEMYATCHMRPNYSALKRYVDHVDGYRVGIDDTPLFVLVHELAHSIHNRFGLHSSFGGVRFPAIEFGGGIGKSAAENLAAMEAHTERWRRPWDAIRSASGANGVAPDETAVSKLRDSISFLEREVVARANPEHSSHMLYASTVRRLESAKEQLAKFEAAGAGQEFYPTDYAFRGGYAEDFAESFALYLLNPARLKKYSPRRFEFIDERFGGGK